MQWHQATAAPSTVAAMSDQQQRPATGFILSVGDELTSGKTVDTNSAFFSQQLAGEGVRVVGHATVSDDAAAIERAIGDAAGKCDLLVISGGIGPTPDDLTRECLARVLGDELVVHDWWIERIRQIWAKRGRPMPESNRKQAAAPSRGELLDNPVGTAGGVRARLGDCDVFVIPGVPKEAKAMLAQHVLPAARELVAQRGGLAIRLRALHTFGVGESDLAERLGELLERGKLGEGVDVGTTAARGVVSVRIYARRPTADEAVATLDDVERRVRDLLGPTIFGADDETLPQATMRALGEHPGRPIVALAESCTGGLIAKLLTDVPGSSDHFHRGVVTYSNESKTELLGVPRELIEQHGAVSEPVALAMARGAGGDVAVSVTGIAGPGGGSEQKPVGTVCIGLAGEGVEVVKTYHLHGDRDMIRLRAAYTALNLLRLHLLGVDV